MQPPSADKEAPCDIHATVAKLLSKHPDAFVVITGDVIHVHLNTTLPSCHQFVDCTTWKNGTLNLLYTKEAYKDTTLPPLGRSDHNLVLLTSQYVPAACLQKDCEEVDSGGQCGPAGLL